MDWTRGYFMEQTKAEASKAGETRLIISEALIGMARRLTAPALTDVILRIPQL